MSHYPNNSHGDLGFGAFEILAEGGLDMADAPARPPELRGWIRAQGALPEVSDLHAPLLASAVQEGLVGRRPGA